MSGLDDQIRIYKEKVESLKQLVPIEGEERVLKQEIKRAERKLEILLGVAQDPSKCYCGGEKGMYFSGTGKQAWCTCEKGRQLRREWVAEKPARMRRRAEKLWSRFDIPPRMTGFRLYSSPLSKTHRELIQRVSMAGSDEIQSQPSWFFSGPPGVGKTGLVVSMAYNFTQRFADRLDRDDVVFVSTPDLLLEIKATYNEHGSEKEVIDHFGSVPLLIIDDIGAEHVATTEWLAEKLYQVIGRRHLALLPTYFTSNHPLGVLRTRVGVRVVQRITEMCGQKNVVELRGTPNARLPGIGAKEEPGQSAKPASRLTTPNGALYREKSTREK